MVTTLKQITPKSELLASASNLIDDTAVKAVVDVAKEIIAVDAPMHYDCEQFLLKSGSKQEDLWGINLYLDEEDIEDIVEFDSMINLRPAQNNRSRGVEDPIIQAKIKEIVAKWLS